MNCSDPAGALERAVPVPPARERAFFVCVARRIDGGRAALLRHSDVFGVTIACLAFGHLLAVTVNLTSGTLEQRPRRGVGWAIAGVATATALALFAASLVFLASGQSFEQFSGMR